jgi:hypothetical protein
VFTWKLSFYGRTLKTIPCVALVYKTSDELRIAIFKILGREENK